MGMLKLILAVVGASITSLFATNEESNIVTELPDGEIQGVDSDYLNLYTDTTMLPFNGTGVFAKYAIPINSILCEYRGPVIKSKDFEGKSWVDFSKSFGIDIPGTGERGVILGQGLCSLINDCAWIADNSYYEDPDVLMALLNTPEDVNNQQLTFQTYPGTSYNAKSFVISPNKVFVVSTREIVAGEEIYYPYGKDYWKTRLENLYGSISSIT